MRRSVSSPWRCGDASPLAGRGAHAPRVRPAYGAIVVAAGIVTVILRRRAGSGRAPGPLSFSGTRASAGLTYWSRTAAAPTMCGMFAGCVRTGTERGARGLNAPELQPAQRRGRYAVRALILLPSVSGAQSAGVSPCASAHTLARECSSAAALVACARARSRRERPPDAPRRSSARRWRRRRAAGRPPGGG
eukprot:scaffold446_cov336-Prasinococcus_capsulatus_cf.AAC.4